MIVVAILAGGTSTRFPVNKLLYQLKGKPLIQFVVDRLRFCKNTLKIVAVVSPYTASLLEDLGIDSVVDNMCIGPIGAIYTTLRLFSEVFVIGGDMPNVTCSFIEKMISLCKEYSYACIPRWSSGYMEPLAAIYKNDILSLLEYGLYVGEYSIQRLVKTLDIEIKVIDIEKNLGNFIDVFTNVNKLEDVRKLLSKSI